MRFCQHVSLFAGQAKKEETGHGPSCRQIRDPTGQKKVGKKEKRISLMKGANNAAFSRRV